MADFDLLAKSRSLAKIALAGAAGLVVLVILLPFLVDHATVSETLILVWGIFLLLAAIILGVALAYVFMTRGLRQPEVSPLAGPVPAQRIAEAGQAGPSSAAGSPPPEVALRLLTGDELRLYRRIVSSGGSVLQKDLVGAGLFSGPKVSRTLDRLEAKGLVTRERHGMTNRIRLSDAWRAKA